MKLNPDCARDVLICLEDNIGMNIGGSLQSLSINQICDFETMKSYEMDDIIYSIMKLIEAGFVIGNISYGGKERRITVSHIEDITYTGHQFLNTIRPKNIWEATKTGASKLGIMSMSALSMISSEIAKAVVTRPEVIQNIVDTFKLL